MSGCWRGKKNAGHDVCGHGNGGRSAGNREEDGDVRGTIPRVEPLVLWPNRCIRRWLRTHRPLAGLARTMNVESDGHWHNGRGRGSL